jgi:hypothetical protein
MVEEERLQHVGYSTDHSPLTIDDSPLIINHYPFPLRAFVRGAGISMAYQVLLEHIAFNPMQNGQVLSGKRHHAGHGMFDVSHLAARKN